MSAFAGFWVDGAVRKPEKRHAGPLGTVVVMDKENNEHGAELERWKLVGCDRYWLDTTSRESLTPEELLSVAKVISPKASRVEKRTDGPFTFWIVDDEDSAVKVDWGSLTQYPPPVERKWTPVTRENVGKYLFQLCRCRNIEQEDWRDGHIVGWSLEDDLCLVESDEHERESVLAWNFVEVLEVS